MITYRPPPRPHPLTLSLRCTTTKTSVTNNADVLAAVNVKFFPDGQAVNHLAMFGNSIVYADDGSIISARAMVQVYFMGY